MRRAVAESGLTLSEVADRAGFNPGDVERVLPHRLPPSVLARLSDILGLTKVQLLDLRTEQIPERPSDPSVVGAYIGEFPQGAARDELAEALGWTFDRIERALAALDQQLRPCGLRLRTRDGNRVDLAGRLELTDGRARMNIERGQASPDIDQLVARFVFRAITGVARVRDDERICAGTARRRGLVEDRQGCVRTTAPVDYSLMLGHRWLYSADPWKERQVMVRQC